MASLISGSFRLSEPEEAQARVIGRHIYQIMSALVTVKMVQFPTYSMKQPLSIRVSRKKQICVYTTTLI